MREQSVADRHEPSALANRVAGHVVETAPLARPAPKPDVHPRIKPAFEFSKAVLLEENHIKTGSRALSGVMAVLLHVVVIAGPILAGLYYTDSINFKQFASTPLVAPLPPPPPPPPAIGAVIKPKVVHPMLMNAGKLLAPTVIPKHIAEIKEPPLSHDSLGGVVGGVPGGVPGGQLGGVLGGVIGGVLNTAARPVPPPPSVKPKGPVRVGGHVRQPKVIVPVLPKYPPLARETHVQGQVQIDAVLDEQGNVIEMKIVSGHPLLYQAALDALKQWKYEPTYLNDRPIAVQLIVTINFQLGQQ